MICEIRKWLLPWGYNARIIIFHRYTIFRQFFTLQTHIETNHSHELCKITRLLVPIASKNQYFGFSCYSTRKNKPFMIFHTLCSNWYWQTAHGIWGPANTTTRSVNSQHNLMHTNLMSHMPNNKKETPFSRIFRSHSTYSVPVYMVIVFCTMPFVYLKGFARAIVRFSDIQYN